MWIYIHISSICICSSKWHQEMEEKTNKKTNNVRGSIIGLRGNIRQYMFPNSMEKCRSWEKMYFIKSAELFALDFGASQMCYLAEMHQRVIEVSSAHHR